MADVLRLVPEERAGSAAGDMTLTSFPDTHLFARTITVRGRAWSAEVLAAGVPD